MIKAILNIEPDRFKMGGLIYIHRQETVNGNTEKRKIRDYITQKKAGVDLTKETEKNIMEKARESFYSISTGEGYTERAGTNEDVIKTIGTAKATSSNMFSGMNLVYGDEVIFINTGGDLNKVIGNIVDWSMLVTKDINTGYNTGVLVPRKILEDYNYIKDVILPKTKDIKGKVM